MLEQTVYPVGFVAPPLLGHISALVRYEKANIAVLNEDTTFVIAGPVILHYLAKEISAKTTVSCAGVEIFSCDKSQYLNFDLFEINKRLIVPKFRLNLVYG